MAESLFTPEQQRTFDTELAEILSHYPPERKSAAMLPALRLLQELKGWCPPEGIVLVAERLGTAVERRRASVYVPRWLRSTQFVRAAMPPVVTWLSRRELPRLAAAEPFSATGLLGAGGRADQAAGRGGPSG